MDKYVVVIGAANIDIGGSPYNELIMEDSNPGRISISYGGVGRNIAENLSRLGVNVKLIAAAGNDIMGKGLVDYCSKCGIDVSSMIIDEEETSSMYMFINNREGDMALALSYVDIAEKITPEYLDSVSDVINSAEYVVMDCNITKDAYKHLKQICKVPICIDPVSLTHASKIKDDLDGIYMIKPNRMEAEFLADIEINCEEDYKTAADILHDKGIINVFISMGSEGIFASYDNKHFIIDRFPTDVISTTGAGDSATAAIIWYLTNIDSRGIISAAKAANAAASMTVNSQRTINPYLSEFNIIQMIESGIMKVRRI